MALGDGTLYNNAKEQFFRGSFALHSHVLKVFLVTGYTPDIDVHDEYADVIASECGGTGYTAGGITLTGQAVTQDNTNNLGKFDANDASWAGLSVGTPSHAILYDDSTGPDLLIAYWELGIASNGGSYTLQWNAGGILTLT